MTAPHAPSANLLAAAETAEDSLWPLLHAAQQSLGCVSPATQQQIAAKLKRPVAEIRGVVEFYHLLSSTPQGEYCLRLSDNITDRFDGNMAVLERLQQRLGVDLGHCRADGRVSLHLTSCIGLADQGPAALINGLPLTRLTLRRAGRIAQLIEQRVPVANWPRRWFHINNTVHRAGPTLGCRIKPGSVLRRAWQLGADTVLQHIKTAGLRGRGGAGFASAQKWQHARDTPADQRFVIANADEGEPGTFKDRALLTLQADALFEGMTLAGWVIGAQRGILYLRGEYQYLLPHLHAVLARRRAAGLLGARLLDTDNAFEIDIHLGAGAYICGEETALIESLEGKRGIPRLRPPFPVNAGYLGKPTLCHNVETLIQAAQIIQNGAAAFASCGTPASPGSKVLSISGDVARPGLYEFPLGVTVQQVLEACGAQNVQAVQVGGPSGCLIAPTEFQRRLCYEDLPTSGSFMVFNHQRDILEIARHFTRFFAFESCGFCTPCRVGTQLLQRAMDTLCSGHGSRQQLNDIEEIGEIMRQTSHCGLGQSAANPLRDSLLRFRALYEARLSTIESSAGFDLEARLAETRQPAPANTTEPAP